MVWCSTRNSPYGRLGTRRLIRGGIKFDTSCLRTTAINRRCRPGLPVCTFLREGLALCVVGAGLCSAPTGCTPKGSPFRGAGSRRLTERSYQICSALIRLGSAVTPSPHRGRLFYAHSRQLCHFSYTQLPQIKYHVSNMANMTIMIWNFRAFFHVRSGLE